jgi:hypothetical protein
MGRRVQNAQASSSWCRCAVFVRRVASGWSFAVVLSASLVGGLVGAGGAVISHESDAPIEESESANSSAICHLTSLKRGDAPAAQPLRVATLRGHHSSNTAGAVWPASAGHRLANGLRAPLRC